jgi:hypothetical protein
MDDMSAGDRRELRFRVAVTPVAFVAGIALTLVDNALAVRCMGRRADVDPSRGPVSAERPAGAA